MLHTMILDTYPKQLVGDLWYYLDITSLSLQPCDNPFFENNGFEDFLKINDGVCNEAMVAIWKSLTSGKKVFLQHFDALFYWEKTMELYDYILKHCENQTCITVKTPLLVSTDFHNPCEIFLQKDFGLRCLQDCTHRELRMGHNLSKMLMSGEFDTYQLSDIPKRTILIGLED